MYKSSQNFSRSAVVMLRNLVRAIFVLLVLTVYVNQALACSNFFSDKRGGFPPTYVPEYNGATRNVFDQKTQKIINEIERIADESFAPGSINAAKVWSVKGRIKAHNLPAQGKIRFVPPPGYNPSRPLPRGQNGGIRDRFGNEWVKGPSRTAGEAYECGMFSYQLWVKNN